MRQGLNSALMTGHVTHARLKPKQHNLAYRIYSLLIDLDELEVLNRRLRFFSVDRFNLFSFYRNDRGDRSGSDLRTQVERSMRNAGLECDGGKILLLTMPRLLGWAFNPLSVYFCYGRDEELKAILWEVDNTFGERHGYLIPVDPSQTNEIHQGCDKNFYVSPFMDMDLRYEFHVRPPQETMSIRIDTLDAQDELVLTARHLARRHALTDRALLSAFVKIPFLTLRVVGGIHWEALKIWLKGIRLRTRPRPPQEAVSVVSRISKHRTALHEPV
ncbi:DUF1365 domain-containing protein [Oryzifoliimicrobium ureilyticus]|uniref:DUF1365 domain-containing protein n=1 Tax=Oryzifoliimicrobium ureilyticus TaxID=3113724 RepID=UPI0030763F50